MSKARLVPVRNPAALSWATRSSSLWSLNRLTSSIAPVAVRRLTGGRDRATDADVFTRPRAPPDADAHVVLGGLGDQGDIGDQCTKEALAIFVRGGGGVPEAREIGRERLEFGSWREWSHLTVLRRQGG